MGRTQTVKVVDCLDLKVVMLVENGRYYIARSFKIFTGHLILVTENSRWFDGLHMIPWTGLLKNRYFEDQ
jgi:hypothetical protein